jgi:hypothetical protein
LPAVNLKAIKDAYIAEYYPEKNFGHDDSLFISRYKQEGDSFRTLLQFDVSQLYLLLSPGAVIKQACLILSLYRNEIPTGIITANIFKITEGWDKNVVTWNSRPSCSDQADETFIVPSQWTDLILVDITKLVRAWLKGVPNHGIMLKGDENDNRVLGFRSTRSESMDDWPGLIIDI